jgi:hypothetical protein
MATSLAAVVLTGGAFAQTPSTNTSWKPFPSNQIGTVAPLPSAANPPATPRTILPAVAPAAVAKAPPPAPANIPVTTFTATANTPAVTFTPPPPSGIGSRVVVYTKPSGDVRPIPGGDPNPVRQVQATDPLKRLTAKRDDDKDKEKDDKDKEKDDKDKEKDDKDKETKEKEDRDKEQKALVAKAVPSLVFTSPEKSRVFSLPSDDDLFAEKLPGMRDSIANSLAKLNKEERKTYQEWEEKQKKKPSKDDPPLSPPRASDYVVTLAGLSMSERTATKPGYAPVQTKLEPGFVVHRRLLFEEKNSERYGWDLGMLQPALSAAYFYKDVLFWPAHMMSTRERYDTNAGKCAAGSPVPYYLYPPQITIRGGIWETAAVVGVVLLLP